MGHTAAKSPEIYYNRSQPWSTRMELDYINRLGTHRLGRGQPYIAMSTREQLLRRYLSASSHRDWGNIDGRRALAFARKELMREMAV
jgi:hypothetical protein